MVQGFSSHRRSDRGRCGAEGQGAGSGAVGALSEETGPCRRQKLVLVAQRLMLLAQRLMRLRQRLMRLRQKRMLLRQRLMLLRQKRMLLRQRVKACVQTRTQPRWGGSLRARFAWGLQTRLPLHAPPHGRGATRFTLHAPPNARRGDAFRHFPTRPAHFPGMLLRSFCVHSHRWRAPSLALAWIFSKRKLSRMRAA